MRERPSPRSVVRAVAGLALVVTLLAGCLNSQQQTSFNLMNRDRKAHGLSSLGSQTSMQSKAQKWAEQLARDNYLHHSTLTSGAPSCWRSLGENIGYGGSLSAVEAAFMNSAPHRANILNGRYTKGGVGVAWR